MIRVFSEQGVKALEDAAAKRALLAFDFDGTLAPIVTDRHRASMRESTRALLRIAARAYPAAVISGRARRDVASRLTSVPLAAIVGNHGAEPGADGPDPRIRRRVESWAAVLRHGLANVPGVDVEDKGLTLAVHYRESRRRDQAVRRIEVVASALPGARVMGGHCVVNVCPIDVPTKRDAVERLAHRLAATAVVYVGDDSTDEDAFSSSTVTVPVRVGRSEESLARYWLDGQEAVDALLEALIAARTRHARDAAQDPAATTGTNGAAT